MDLLSSRVKLSDVYEIPEEVVREPYSSAFARFSAVEPVEAWYQFAARRVVTRRGTIEAFGDRQMSFRHGGHVVPCKPESALETHLHAFQFFAL